MKTIIQKIRYLILAILVMTNVQGFAQKAYALSSEQEYKVEGTSTIHDWEMESKAAKGTVSATVLNQKLEELHSLEVELPVKTLKSGKNSMDDNAYEALDAKKHPNIRFKLTTVEAITDQTVRARGHLIIAGTSRNITIDATYHTSGNTIRFKGSLPVSFTDFNIEPPKAVFGTIKTGNELQISFETTFVSTN